jgi:hypothetical protein
MNYDFLTITVDDKTDEKLTPELVNKIAEVLEREFPQATIRFAVDHQVCCGPTTD